MGKETLSKGRDRPNRFDSMLQIVDKLANKLVNSFEIRARESQYAAYLLHQQHALKTQNNSTQQITSIQKRLHEVNIRADYLHAYCCINEQSCFVSNPQETSSILPKPIPYKNVPDVGFKRKIKKIPLLPKVVSLDNLIDMHEPYIVDLTEDDEERILNNESSPYIPSQAAIEIDEEDADLLCLSF